LTDKGFGYCTLQEKGGTYGKLVVFLVNTFGGHSHFRRDYCGSYFHLGIRRSIGSINSSGTPWTGMAAGSGIFCGDFCTFIFHQTLGDEILKQ
jgi:hypothetical protein